MRQPVPKLKPRDSSYYWTVALLLFFVTMMALCVVPISYLQTQADFFNADSLSLTMMFQKPFALHSIFAMDYHTFLFKLPLFFMEQKIGLSVTSHTVLSSLFLISMFASVTYIAWQLLERDPKKTMITLALLLGVFLAGQQYLFLNNISMPTMRNIEYGMFLLSYYWLIRGIQRKLVVTGAIMLAVLAASDPLFIILGVAASGFTVLYRLIRQRKSSKKTINDAVYRSALIGIIASATGPMILLLAVKTGLIVADLHSSSYVSGMVRDLPEFLRMLGEGMLGLLASFGMGVYPSTPAYVLPVTIMMAATFAGLVMVCSTGLRAAFKADTANHSWREEYALFLFGVIATSIIAYALTRHTGGAMEARFLHINLFAGVLLGAFGLKAAAPMLPSKLIPYSVAVILLAGAASGFSQALIMRDYYAVNHAPIFKRLNEILRHENIRYITGDYWDIYPFSAQMSDKSHDYTVLPVTTCRKAISTYIDIRWWQDAQLLPPDTPMAVIATPDQPVQSTDTTCNLIGAILTYGKPPRAYPLVSAGSSDPVYYVLVYPSSTVMKHINLAPVTNKLQKL